MDADTEARVVELRGMLEAELDRRTSSRFGCWPLLVALAGVVVGLLLLGVSC